MDENRLSEFYTECMNMDLGKMLNLILSTDSGEMKIFYTELYNFVLRKRQKELIADGIF